jgi:hypothetical protein
MSTETLSQAIGAGATVTFGGGSIFNLVTATGPVDIVAVRIGDSSKGRVFKGCPAGFKFTADSPDDGFSLLKVTSATAQTVTIAIGDDDVSFANAVTIQGSAVTSELQTAAVTDAAVKACANAAQTNVVAQNLSRRMVTLTLDPGAAAGTVCYFRSTGGANNLIPVQPGQSVRFPGTYAVDLRNDSGAAVNVYIFEES